MRQSFKKDPYEEFAIVVDFSENFGTGEAISTKTVVGYDSDGTVVTSSIIASSAIVPDTQVSVEVKGGASGEWFTITVQCVTSIGAKWELDIIMEVRD